MSHVHNGAAGSSLVTSSTLPDGGDKIKAADVNTTFEPTLNNFATINAHGIFDTTVCPNGTTHGNANPCKLGRGLAIGQAYQAGDVWEVPPEVLYKNGPRLKAISRQLAVTGATNATPIVITTSAAHGLRTGDKVNVFAVVGNTAANGNWVVNVLTSTTFELVGSVGSAPYASGGGVVRSAEIEYEQPRLATRTLGSPWFSTDLDRSWYRSPTGFWEALSADPVAEGNVIGWDLHPGDIPQGAKITGAHLLMQPPGTLAAVPAERGTLKLIKVALDGTFTEIASALDPVSSPLATYTNARVLHLTPLTEIVDYSRFTYAIVFTTAWNTDALEGTSVWAPYVDYQTSNARQDG